jgi:mRNA interferase RelE/StbE
MTGEWWYTALMLYDVELKPRARKDLRRIARSDAAQIVAALNELKNDLNGDIKRLTNFTPEYLTVLRVLNKK